MKTTVNGIDIAYDDIGAADAPAVVFIHGFPLNRHVWQSQVDALKTHCRVISYDLRGFGDSGTGEGPFSMTLFVEDLIGLMDALRIRQATLCGLSMGGYIALHAVESHPERFNALVLSDTQCTADTNQGQAKRLAAIKSIKDEGVACFADAQIEHLFSTVSMDRHPDTVKAVQQIITATDPSSLERALEAMRGRQESCSKLPNIKVPTLILVGEADRITPVDTAVYLHENIEHSHLTIIEQAGHLSNLENPEQFNAALKKFLTAIMH
jgi:3-oxoadipate enol-lactonase